MIARTALLVFVFGLLGDTAPERGREGNARFAEAKYVAAAAAYRAGLRALADTTTAAYVGLQNNLGLALYRQGRLDAAGAALRRARRAARTEPQRVRALFNAATVAAERSDRAAALQHLEKVLLRRPRHADARYNYEYLKRQRGGGEGAEPPPIEPSPFAERLKERAETLVARRQYTTAAALLKDGVRKDSTVQAYRAFIARVEDIAQIARSAP